MSPPQAKHGSSADVVAVIAARGGSKGIPQKNVRPLAGKPLIAWTIEAARRSRRLNRVIVSTDDPEIAAISRRWGAEVPFRRPGELSSDDASHVDTILHAVCWIGEHDAHAPDYVMSLQATSPLRTTEDIDAAVEVALNHDVDAVAAVHQTSGHPYLCKSIDAAGALHDFVSTEIPYLRRQDLPPSYAINGDVNLQRCAAFLRHRQWIPEGTLAHVMPRSRSLDIDSQWDLYVAELVLRDKHGRQAA